MSLMLTYDGNCRLWFQSQHFEVMKCASVRHLHPLPLCQGAVSEHGSLKNLLYTIAYFFLEAC